MIKEQLQEGDVVLFMPRGDDHYNNWQIGEVISTPQDGGILNIQVNSTHYYIEGIFDIGPVLRPGRQMTALNKDNRAKLPWLETLSLRVDLAGLTTRQADRICHFLGNDKRTSHRYLFTNGNKVCVTSDPATVEQLHTWVDVDPLALLATIDNLEERPAVF